MSQPHTAAAAAATEVAMETTVEGDVDENLEGETEATTATQNLTEEFGENNQSSSAKPSSKPAKVQATEKKIPLPVEKKRKVNATVVTDGKEDLKDERKEEKKKKEKGENKTKPPRAKTQQKKPNKQHRAEDEVEEAEEGGKEKNGITDKEIENDQSSSSSSAALGGKTGKGAEGGPIDVCVLYSKSGSTPTFDSEVYLGVDWKKLKGFKDYVNSINGLPVQDLKIEKARDWANYVWVMRNSNGNVPLKSDQLLLARHPKTYPPKKRHERMKVEVLALIVEPAVSCRPLVVQKLETKDGSGTFTVANFDMKFSTEERQTSEIYRKLKLLDEYMKDFYTHFAIRGKYEPFIPEPEPERDQDDNILYDSDGEILRHNPVHISFRLPTTKAPKPKKNQKKSYQPPFEPSIKWDEVVLLEKGKPVAKEERTRFLQYLTDENFYTAICRVQWLISSCSNYQGKWKIRTQVVRMIDLKKRPMLRKVVDREIKQWTTERWSEGEEEEEGEEERDKEEEEQDEIPKRKKGKSKALKKASSKNNPKGTTPLSESSNKKKRKSAGPRISADDDDRSSSSGVVASTTTTSEDFESYSNMNTGED